MTRPSYKGESVWDLEKFHRLLKAFLGIPSHHSHLQKHLKMPILSSSCIVPPELQLDVLEYLRDDNDALHNCSLVSKTWAEYCRSYLWEKIALIRKDEAGVVSEKHSAPVMGKEVEYFFHPTSMEDATAFFTVNPVVAKLVKKLRIDGFIGVTVNILSCLLAALPNLCHLEILYTNFPPLAENLSDLDRKQFTTKPVYAHRLDCVYFHRCNIVERDIDILLRVLGLFSSIDTLDFEGSESAFNKIQGEGWSFDPAIHLRLDVPHPPLPEVHRLVPDVVHASILGYLFNNSTLTRNLEFLWIPPATVWTYKDLEYMAHTLLPAVSDTLKHFNFTPGPSMAVNLPQGVEEHEKMDKVFTRIAKSCASVEHITLQLVHNLMPGWQPLDFSYLVDGFVKILERLPPSAALKTIMISLPIEDAMGIVPPRTVPTAEVITGYNWPGLERVLLGGPRSEVTLELRISFMTLVAPTDERQGFFQPSMSMGKSKQLEFAKNVWKQMPRLSKTGRLDILFGECRTSKWRPSKDSPGVSPP